MNRTDELEAHYRTVQATAQPRTRLKVRWGRIVASVALALLIYFFIDWMTDLMATPTLPPCPTEDSTGCYWDGDTMGNGIGDDLVSP